MVIFELPATAEGESLRAATLGSCRVRDPVYVLRDRGDLRLCDSGMGATHSAPEALQTLQLVLGERQIPDTLSPYVFETETAPPVDSLARTLREGVDVFVAEISDDKQFTYGEVHFNQNFTSRNLVKSHGSAMLGWYREVCLGRPVDEDLVQSTLGKLREGGFPADALMADLLRGVRLRRDDVDEIAAALSQMMVKAGGRWVVIGAFLVPGHEGAIMHDRRVLNKKLENAAARCGAAFYDPSALVATYGRETVLDAGGANVFEYAESFYPVVGETLVSLVRTGRGAPRRDSATPPSSATSATPAPPAKVRRALAGRLNGELMRLHRERVDELGLEASGLYAYYKTRMEKGSLIGAREVGAFDLIDAYLPAYDAYGVMRAGLGELALLLAASGRRVMAYEPNANRRSAIEAGAAHLEDAGMLAPGRLTTVASLTPEERLKGRVLGVGLNVAHVHNEADAARYMARIAAFEALLIDLRLFIRQREKPQEQSLLTVDLRAMGFDQRRDYPGEELFWFGRTQT